MRTPISPRSAALVVAFVVGFGVFAVACVSDILLLTTGGGPWLAVAGDLTLGAFAAALVLYYEWRQNANLRRKLSTIAEMNHHVRNQLEIIAYSAWTTRDMAHIARMQESIAHIEWALREILDQENQGADTPPPSKPPASANPPDTRQTEASANSVSRTV